MGTPLPPPAADPSVPPDMGAPQAQPPGAPSETPESDAANWGDDAAKWKELAQKHEKRARRNADAARQLESTSAELAELKRASQSDAERAVSDARTEGESAAADRYRAVIARHALNAAAAQEQKSVPEAAVGRMNLADLVADDGTVDTDALKEIVSGFAPIAGAKPAGPPPDPAQRANRGRGQGGKQNADDLMAAGADLYRSTFPKQN
jgi:hypothetical protein